MDKNASMGVIGLVLIVAMVIVAVVVLAYMGVIPLNLGALTGDNAANDLDDPAGAQNCDFATGVIVDMFENMMGKDLNNDVGYTVVHALNMRACGSDGVEATEVVDEYEIAWADDWYLLDRDTDVRNGFYYVACIWGNAPNLGESTLIRGVLSGSGSTIEEWYGYHTMTINSEGSRSGYLAFVAWLTS